MIPETIPKAQMISAVESLGLTANEITKLTISPDLLQATVIVKDETGQRVYKNGEYQKRQIKIRITP